MKKTCDWSKYHRSFPSKCKMCGKDMMVRKESTGICKSCAHKKEYGMSNLNALFSTYKKGARQREIEFNLTLEQFKLITKQNCYYCGIEPLQLHENRKQAPWNGFWLHNGIDRLDNNKGYTVENSVPCCKFCNLAKHTLSAEEFLINISRIYRYQNKNR